MSKTIIFDMDGVITNTEKLHYEAWRKAFRDIDYILSFEQYKKTLQSRNREEGILNNIPDATETLIERISYLKSMYYEELINDPFEVYTDTLRVIKELDKNNVKMAVASASSYAEKLLKKVKLDTYFDLIVSGTKGLNIKNKPEKDIYDYVMHELKSTPEQTIVVEDSESGIIAGQRSGAFVVGINRGSLHVEDNTNLLIVNELSYDLLKSI